MDGIASDDDEAQGEEVIWVLTIVVTGGLMAWAFASGAKAKAKRADTLGKLAKRLQGRSDAEAGLVTGAMDGTKVRYEYATRGSGSSTEYWTYIDAEIPPYPLRLYVRRHGWRDQGKIDRGEMIDVQVGSEPFDNAFLVEAAPADVVARMFDHEAMQYLLGEKAHLEITIESRALRLSMRRWITDLYEACAAVDCMVRIAKRVREAYAEVEQETAPRDVGSPYRPQLDDQPARDAAEARRAEIETFDRVRMARLSKSHFTIIMIFITIAFGVVVMAMTR